MTAATLNFSFNAYNFDEQRERVRVAHFNSDQSHLPLDPTNAFVCPFLFLYECAVPDD